MRGEKKNWKKGGGRRVKKEEEEGRKSKKSRKERKKNRLREKYEEKGGRQMRGNEGVKGGTIAVSIRADRQTDRSIKLPPETLIRLEH